MSFDKTRARATLEELLDLAGVPQPELFENRNQQEEIEADYIEEDLSEADDEPGEEPDEDSEAELKGKKKEKPEDEEEPEEEEKPEEDSGEELHDTWTTTIKAGGKFKFEMYENYFYIWYRSKKSERMDISPKFKAMRKELAKMINQIMTYIEKAS